MDLNTFILIMVFYAIITFVVGPLVAWNHENTLDSAGDGFVIGSLVSIALWYSVGRKQ